jgi:hypothetical protein
LQIWVESAAVVVTAAGTLILAHLRAKGVRSCEVARHWSIEKLEGSWPEQQVQLRLVRCP